MRVGITGAGGMLGTALIDKLCVENEIYATDKNEGLKKEKVYWSCFDLLDFDLLKKWLQTSRVDVVIHCAAIVDVDMCEAMPKQAEDLHVNSTKIIAEYLDSFNGYLIYISTDLLFDDKKQTPYTEEDITNPLNVYAKTKLDGELVVLGMKNGLVLRTNIIGWSRSSKLSFFEWVLKAFVFLMMSFFLHYM